MSDDDEISPRFKDIYIIETILNNIYILFV